MADLITDLVALLHPIPAHTDPPRDGEDEAAAAAVRAREDLRDNLDAALDADPDGDFDPLLSQIAAAQEQRRAADARLRLLLAYGVEFVRPRGYSLDVLAAAAGMTKSGVRTAYGPAEVDVVADRIGGRPRRRGNGER